MHFKSQNGIFARVLVPMLFALGLFLVPNVARAQVVVDDSYVSVTACNSPAASCTVYDESPVPPGDAILVIASWGGSTTTATISDGENSYATILGPTNAKSGGSRGQAWIANGVAAGVRQITLTLSAPSTPAQILLWMIPIKGLDPTAPVDANVTQTNAGNGTSMTTGNSGSYSAVPNEMIWGIFLEDNYSNPFNPGPGFTSLSGQEAASLIEYRSVTRPGPQMAVGTNGRGAGNWIGAVFGLKAAGQTGDSSTLTSIAVTPTSPFLVAGVTQQFTATGTYGDGSTRDLTNSVTWTSSNTAIATINAAGLSTSLGAGTTTIQAVSDSISGSTGFMVSGSSSAGTLPGLVGYWAFNEGSGTTAADSSGNGLTASLSNGITWGTGKIGGAISVDGVDQYSTNPAIDLTSTSATTVVAWVNRTYSDGSGAVLFEFSDNFNNTNNAFAFFPEGADVCGAPALAISLIGNSGYDINCYAQPSSGVWHQLVAVYDMSQASANSVTYYMDGALQTALSQPYSSNNTNTFGDYPLYLFSRGGTTDFTSGEISDLQVYNRALSASDVQQLYNSVAADFTLTALPGSRTIIQGDGTSYTATLTPLNDFHGSVTLSASGLPAHAQASFSSTQIASGSSTLSITTDPATPPGSYTLTIAGTSGSLTHSATAALVVAVPPAFSLAASPGWQNVIQGSATSFVPAVTVSNGSAAPISFSVTGLPTGASGTYNPASVVGSGSSALTVTTAASTPVGSYTLTITATSGSLAHSATVTLVVTGPPNFSLAVSPSSQTVIQGANVSYTSTVQRLNGFNSAVAFSVSGLPTGATGTFNPPSLTGFGTSTLTVATAAATPAGSYTVTITGTSGSLVQIATATLVVNPSGAGNFTIAASQTSRTVVQGNSTTYRETVTATGAFGGAVAFSVTGLPTGATATFSPASVTASGATTMTAATSLSTPMGTYPLVITGTSGSLNKSVTVSLVITGGFAVSLSPASQAVTAGSAASYTVTVTRGAGFAGTVIFSASSLPTGATAVFSPSSVTGSGSTALTVTTSTATPKRGYNLTINGIGGGLSVGSTATLTVQ